MGIEIDALNSKSSRIDKSPAGCQSSFCVKTTKTYCTKIKPKLSDILIHQPICSRQLKARKNPRFVRRWSHGSSDDAFLNMQYNDPRIGLDKAIQNFIQVLERYSEKHHLYSAAVRTLNFALGAFLGKKELAIDYDLAINCDDAEQKRHAFRVIDCSSLITQLADFAWVGFKQNDNLSDLNLAIQRHNEALVMRAVSHPDRPLSLYHLSLALWHRFNRESLSLGYTDRATLVKDIAGLLQARYRKQDQVADLELAVKYLNEAVTLFPRGTDTHLSLLKDLGLASYNLFAKSNNINDLESAINVFTDAMCLTHPHHSDRITLLTNLCAAFWSRYNHGDETAEYADLELAIKHLADALRLSSPDQSDYAGVLNNLGGALFTRSRRQIDSQDLKLAIVYLSEAVSLPHHPDRLSSFINLSGALETRWPRATLKTKLFRSVLLAIPIVVAYSKSLDLIEEIVFVVVVILGLVVRDLYYEFGDAKDLNLAITYFEQALQARQFSPNNTEGDTLLKNLAVAFSDRFNLSKDEEDLELAIKYFYDALAVSPPGHRDHASSYNNLGGTFHSRYGHSHNMVDLNMAIDYMTNAVELCPSGHPRRPSFILNLANVLLLRFESLHDPADFNLILTHLDCAKVLLPLDHPGLYIAYLTYKSAYFQKYFMHHREDDREEGLRYCHKAVNHPTASTKLRLSSSLEWISLARGHASQLTAYATSLRLLDLHVVLAPSLASRHQIRGTAVSPTLASDAASCAIERGLSHVAIELLEQGRALLWAQLARFRTPLDRLRALGVKERDLANRFDYLSRLLERGGASPNKVFHASTNEEAYTHRGLRREWDSVVNEIRQIDGFSNFLQPTPFAELQKAASHGPVIIVNTSQYRCDAIIVFEIGPIKLVPLGITSQAVASLSAVFAEALRHTVGLGEEKQREQQITPILRDLWEFIVHPIVQALQDIVPRGSRIWWCPTSRLTSLPLHAAGPYPKGQPNLSSIYISSYTPTLSALIRSRHELVISKTQSFLAIGQARPSRNNEQGELKSVEKELEAVRKLIFPSMPFRQLKGEEATGEAAICGFRDHSWIHLACHGKQDTLNPYDSYFAMHENPLRLEIIIQADLVHREFAFLSACYTAVGDENMPDEVIHLAAGMQFSGFRSVIGTMLHGREILW
ncbi:hypothetical protein SERLA73DRAFT_159817 [Serpula lacrymans var. lacrymans S7.3]|uniref:CHAT domain-containing protein n=1 Tax=Serpula lacrymans var. lacrymans (strain S7.3) TaxID=936435 RepID=F8PVW4_SERL3|nr:hypothetical protein SERLA73DRAFT_159817 [Serpula lacrymans var. lacrymans S7.3]